MLNKTDLSRVDLNLLVLFEAVMQELHVGRTAAQMNLSPSAISHGLRRLRRLFDDPLFLRTPRGVVATDRAEELRAPVADALAKLRTILSTPEAFDPASSQRRFMLGAPDGISAVVLPLLLARLGTAPGVRIGCRELLPDPGEAAPERAWRSSFALLESRAVDIAILPFGSVTGRFAAEPLYQEDFVVAMRSHHPLVDRFTLDAYCTAKHLLVSESGDPVGFVDALLAKHGRQRVVTATAPNFMLALSLLSGSDFVAALPRRLVALHGHRFGVVAVEPPVELGSFALSAVLPGDARSDRGLAWLLGLLKQVTASR
mgnify:CR=1 FL=1